MACSLNCGHLSVFTVLPRCRLSLLADLAALCFARRSTCRLGKVLGDHPVLPQSADAALHNPQDLLKPAVQRCQVGLGEDGVQRILLQGLPHHVAEPVLRLGQQLEAQQRGALYPESDTHETCVFVQIFTDQDKLVQAFKLIPSHSHKCWRVIDYKLMRVNDESDSCKNLNLQTALRQRCEDGRLILGMFSKPERTQDAVEKMN